MGSTIPAVIDELVRLTAAALPGVQVVDGQPVVQVEADFISIAYGEDGEPAAESTRTRNQMTATPDQESYDVWCIASAWDGDVDMQATRARAYGLVDAIAAAIAADITLGGLVMSARLASESLYLDQTTKGAVATVRFFVHVDAFTT